MPHDTYNNNNNKEQKINASTLTVASYILLKIQFIQI